MTKGFSYVGGSGIKRNGSFIVRTTFILSLLAILLILVLIMTVITSNSLMNIESKEISNVPSNILPSYSTTSFESIDGQTNLSGWFFKCDNPITTMIVVHDTGSNRLPFGVEMIDLIESLLDNNYNVFLFDLRNSGESSGDISTYGYLEWKDVVGAINKIKQISVTTNVVLYGIGSGSLSCILAYNNLPTADMTDDELKNFDRAVLDTKLYRSYIVGMVFDSPAKESDDYIRPLVKRTFMGEITKYLVPYAIRLSAGIPDSISLIAEISRLPIPVCILYGGHDTFVGAEKISQLVDERNRLNPSITVSSMIPGAGYLESYNLGKESYINTVITYMNTYFI